MSQTERDREKQQAEQTGEDHTARRKWMEPPRSESMFRQELEQILHDDAPKAPAIRLEVEAQAELHLAHACVVGQAGDCTASGTVDTGIGITQVRVVEHVEGLGAELHLDLLPDGNILRHRQITVKPFRPDDAVALRIAEAR